ncbi:uncharacterized protein DSM5745_08761 [Aspergillus mulundensis]|uniref:Ig-like domain-containing protein n=1 Tax=Aspergillus mulundensis TaxID=1810919 RepID=A0A3D8R4Z5_9EURO|nr:hypothetical protein DSM5745_08761 [Aspergillus mulundensis]RDW69001.1 hypothetical protein DSM5745_08761 [Aspergillus mulundensis]
MHRLIVFMLMVLLAFMASGAPTSSLEIPETIVTDMTWDLQLYPGGPNITLTGTAEKVYAKITELNPNYDQDWEEDLTLESDTYIFTPDAATERVPYWVSCVRGKGARWSQVNEGIQFLHKLRGQPHLGPHQCARVTCSGDSGIHWCNDANYPRTLLSWNYIADAAAAVIMECMDSHLVPFSGNVFHDDNWRAIVKGDKC